MEKTIEETLTTLQRQINWVTRGEYTRELSEMFNIARQDSGIILAERTDQYEEVHRTYRELRRLLVDTCCEFFAITRKQLFGRSRKRCIVEARQTCMYLMRKYKLYGSLKEIGRFFGKRDHSTVIHAINNIDSLLYTDINFENKLTEIEKIVFKGLSVEKWD